MNGFKAFFPLIFPHRLTVLPEAIELREHTFLTSDEKSFFTVIAASPELAEIMASRIRKRLPDRLRAGFRYGRSGERLTHWRLTLNGGVVYCSIGATLEDALSLADAHIGLPDGVSVAAVTQSVERLSGSPKSSDWRPR